MINPAPAFMTGIPAPASLQPPPFDRATLPDAGVLPALPASFNQDVLTRLENDPYCAALLDRLRKATAEGFADVVDQLYRALMVSGKTAPVIGVATDLRTVIAASRRSESQGRQCRETAEALALGYLHNIDNPHWDPADAATSRSGTDNVLLTLLTGPLPAAR